MYIQEEKACRDEAITAKDQLIKEKDRDLVSFLQKCSSLQMQLETVRRENQSLEVSGNMLTM